MIARVARLVTIAALGVLACGESTSGDGNSAGASGMGAAGGTAGTGGTGAGAGGSSGVSGSAGSTTSGGSSGSSTGGASSGGAGAAGTAGSTTGGGGSGGSQAGEGGSGGADCGCVDEELTWGSDGGFVAYVEESSLAPCAEFTNTRRSPGTPDPALECTQDLSMCGGGVSAQAVAEALAHPDVVAARAAAPVLYGRDTRPVDGQVTRLDLAGDIVEVGWECAGSSGCTPIPEGVATLVELLQALTEQELARGECAGVFGN